jgi:polysaccharide export outer membrane protein
MIETKKLSVTLAAVVLFSLGCAGQQNSQTTLFAAPSTDEARPTATPDEVSHTFDSPIVVSAEKPTAAVPAATAAKAESAPAPVKTARVETTPVPEAAPMQAANQTPTVTPVADTASVNTSAAPAGFQQRHPRYLLRAGDVFDVNFEYSPEFNQTVNVQPDGFITLREAGDIYVQGLTLEQLNQAIRTGYKDVLHAPSIAIIPKNFEQPYFVVGGEVKTPGKFDLRGPMTVAQAVALAGGFTESAKHSHVLLFHRESPDQAIVVHTLNVKRMLNHEDLKEDAELRPGDMIYVPQNTISKIKGYVIPKATVGPTVRPQL